VFCGRLTIGPTATDANYCIDDHRIFSVGFSMGGMMSDTVGCELGGTRGGHQHRGRSARA
jgi:dienelactone hydrolase